MSESSCTLTSTSVVMVSKWGYIQHTLNCLLHTTPVILISHFIDFVLEMRNDTVTVDEGVDNNTQICLTVTSIGGSIVQCPLIVTLGTIEGTASMSIFLSL